MEVFMNRKNFRRLISIILVVYMVILSGLTPKESFWGTAKSGFGESNGLHNITDVECLLLTEDAIVPCNNIHEYSTDEYRILCRKGSGNAGRQLRILHFICILLYSIFAMPLLWAFYVYFIGDRVQKLLIIKYIHNKDGRKGTSIIRYS